MNQYKLVPAPVGYPGRIYRRGFVYAHHLAWWLETGETVPEGLVIHHRDGDRANNDISNLELLTRSEHSTHHGSTGVTRITLECGSCHKQFKRDARQVNAKESQGQTIFFCSRSCVGRYRGISRSYRGV